MCESTIEQHRVDIDKGKTSFASLWLNKVRPSFRIRLEIWALMRFVRLRRGVAMTFFHEINFLFRFYCSYCFFLFLATWVESELTSKPAALRFQRQIDVNLRPIFSLLFCCRWNAKLLSRSMELVATKFSIWEHLKFHSR